MVGTSLSPITLPKSAALTDALIAPPGSLVGDDELAALRLSFADGLRGASDGMGVDRVQIDAYRLRALLEGALEEERPFEWSPSKARRSIGIECLRACRARGDLSPLAAANEEVTRLVRRHEQEGSAAGRLAEWLAPLGTGARAVVAAEAAGWTTQLLTALQWSRIDRPIIGAGRRVVLPSVPNVALRTRFEVAHRLEAAEGRIPASIFLMMNGRPAATTQGELGLAALTLALDDRRPMTPYRVVAWWPQSGRALIQNVDARLLRDTADLVVTAVQRVPRSAHRAAAGPSRSPKRVIRSADAGRRKLPAAS